MVKYFVSAIFLLSVSSTLAGPLTLGDLLGVFQKTKPTIEAAEQKMQESMAKVVGQSFGEILPSLNADINAMNQGYRNAAQQLRLIGNSFQQIAGNVRGAELRSIQSNLNTVADGYDFFAQANHRVANTLFRNARYLAKDSNPIPEFLVSAFVNSEAGVANTFQNMANAYANLSNQFTTLALRADSSEADQWVQIAVSASNDAATLFNAATLVRNALEELQITPPKTTGGLVKTFIGETSGLASVYLNLVA